MSGVSESPFATTIYADGPRRRQLLGLIGSAYVPGRTTKFSRMRSWSDMSRTAASSIDFADRHYYEAATQAVLRERQACAEIAGKHSPQAASEILSRPLPAAWVAP